MNPNSSQVAGVASAPAPIAAVRAEYDVAVIGAGPAGLTAAALCVCTCMPGCTTTWQPWRLPTPSTVTRHSKHTPIMQYGPRGAPLTGVLRQLARPAASSAAATVSPARACAGAPSIVIGTAGAEAASGSRWNMESPC